MGKRKRKKMIVSREEAVETLRDWADFMECDYELPFFKDIEDQLTRSVRTESISFDEESENFNYKLIVPIDGDEETAEKKLIKIFETDFNAKKAMQKFSESESIDSAQVMLSKYTDLDKYQVSCLKDRDIQNINAVILGFFVQTGSAKK